MATELQVFADKWKKGCGSEYCTGALNIVLGKGDIPCDVLFVGEAPGHSENVNGVPFDGPAGRYLDDIVEAGVRGRATCAYTNLVCCIPIDETGQKTKEPDHDQIMRCSGRLVEFIRIANPKLLVCVDKAAEEYTDPWLKNAIKLPTGIRRVAILHPSYILRLPSGSHEHTKRKMALIIETALDELLGTGHGPGPQSPEEIGTTTDYSDDIPF